MIQPVEMINSEGLNTEIPQTPVEKKEEQPEQPNALQILIEPASSTANLLGLQNPAEKYLAPETRPVPTAEEFNQKITNDYRQTAHELIVKDYSTSQLEDLEKSLKEVYEIKNSNRVEDLNAQLGILMNKLSHQFIKQTMLNKDDPIPFDHFQKLAGAITNIRSNVNNDTDNETLQLYWDKLSDDIRLLMDQIKNKDGEFKSLGEIREVEETVKRYLDNQNEILKPILNNVLSEINNLEIYNPKSDELEVPQTTVQPQPARAVGPVEKPEPATPQAPTAPAIPVEKPGTATPAAITATPAAVAPAPEPTTQDLALTSPKDLEKTGITITPSTKDTDSQPNIFTRALNYMISSISSIWNSFWSSSFGHIGYVN